MPRTTDSEDDVDGGEDDDLEDYPGADDPGVFWCPKCGAEMYGDSARCPTCGDFVTPGARPSAATPWWIRAGVILIGLALLAGLGAALLR